MIKYLMVILFLVASCKAEKASTLTSGTLQDSLNSSSTVTLNYRIDPQAISAHQALVTYKALTLINEERIPQSWVFPPVVRVKNVLGYILNINNPDAIEDLDIGLNDGFLKITYRTQKEQGQMLINKSASELKWVDESGDVISLKKEGSIWQIQKASHFFFWNPQSKELCDAFDCLKI